MRPGVPLNLLTGSPRDGDGEFSIVEQAGHGVGQRRGVCGGNDQAGLAIAHQQVCKAKCVIPGWRPSIVSR